MSFDEICGHQTLEPSYGKGVSAGTVGAGGDAGSAIALAASCPAHGCWDEEGVEELERWDGMG